MLDFWEYFCIFGILGPIAKVQPVAKLGPFAQLGSVAMVVPAALVGSVAKLEPYQPTEQPAANRKPTSRKPTDSPIGQVFMSPYGPGPAP